MTVKELKEYHINHMQDDDVIACIIWQKSDVQGIAEEDGYSLTDREAKEIIEIIDTHKDCELGITWETIRITTSDYVAEREIAGGDYYTERG